MNPLKLFRLLGLYEKAEALSKENAPMKVKVPQLLALICTLSATIGLPNIITGWVHAHLGAYAALVGAAMVLHALLPSLFAEPSASDQQAAGLSKSATLLLAASLVLGAAPAVRAQAQTSAPAQVAPIQNLYAAGMSYGINASPAVAGTALYAHLVAGAGTYAFTAVDAVPNTIKPFTVSSNIGVGIAQKVATLGKLPVYMPTAAGISWSGSNTGWQWNSGVVTLIHLKNSYYLLPSVRFLKSSVSNGSGYQPIIGVLFAWGQ